MSTSTTTRNKKENEGKKCWVGSGAGGGFKMADRGRAARWRNNNALRKKPILPWLTARCLVTSHGRAGGREWGGGGGGGGGGGLGGRAGRG